MISKVEQALNIAIRNWQSMTAANEDAAESTANEFESSFYTFIDTVREWVYGLEQQPHNLEELMELSFIQHILGRLPAPLHLNFETEAELILEHQSRVDEDKYD